MRIRCLLCALAWACLVARVAESAYAGEVLVGGAEPLGGPMGVALAPDGGLIVADTDQNRILKCPNWQLQGFQQASCQLLAGGSSSGFEADRLRTPYTALPAQVEGATFGLVVADTHNHRIQYWPPGATEGYTLVGGPGVGAPGYAGPGELQFPAGIALDEDAGYLYVSDTGHHRVVRYTLNLDADMQVVGAGVTVAGTYGTSGTAENLLDNPTALVLDAPRHRLYVADARNNRVMLWLLTPYLLDSEGIAARRLSSIDSDADGNETGNTTTSITETTTATATTSSSYTTSSTYTSTISSTRTTSSTTSTTSTMYEGPRYQLHLTGLVGRPYGLFSQDDALYVSDADGCTIWKKLQTGEVAVVAGGSCGGSLAQVYFPAGILVERGGAIVVADSRNNRILRFGPEPDSVSDKCTLGGLCQLTLRNGLPTPRSRMVLVYSDFRSQCGGRCLASGIGGGSWVNIAPADKPHLNVMVFDFGVGGYGDTMRDYILCFGTEPDEQQVNDGDCTTMPYNVGTVRMLPFLQADEDSLATECISGTPCAISLNGYGIPDTIVVSAPPDSAAGSGVVCGTGSNQNFQGYRSFVMSNPGVLLGIDEPFIAEGNRTATVRIDFGQALSLGSQLLCVCYQGNDCFAPTRFTEPAGFLRVRSALGGDTYYCRVGETCVLNVTGRYLRSQDAAAITSAFLIRCPSLVFEDSMQLPFDTPVANVSFSSPTSLWVDDGLGYSLVDVGRPSTDGRFQVCYCASYDGEDADDQPCSTPAEFTQPAGFVAVVRVDPQDYECALGRNCTIVASGSDMKASDSILEAAGRTSTACGVVVPQPESVIAGVVFPANFFDAEAGSPYDTNGTQLFELGRFADPGPRQLCYCSSFNEDPTGLYDSVQGSCNDEGEFYQPLGTLTVRGPSRATVECPANLPCQVSVNGVRLSSLDVLQVCPSQSSCGNITACEPAGPAALGGLLSPVVASSTQTTYELGSLPLGSYGLCYCAPGVNGTAEIPCAAPADLDMLAGELRVRGVQGGQLFECVENIRCEMDILGFDLTTFHAIQAVPLNGTCGETDAVSEINVFNPNVMVTGEVGVGNLSSRRFVYDQVTVPQRYKICYCMLSSCDNATHFTEEVGILVVKGVEKLRYARTCSLGERCGLTFNGSGMENGTDSIKLLPSGYPCGGGYLRVVGGDENGTADLNGIYERGNFLFNDRTFFVQRGGRNLIFYNNFRGWWVIYHELDTKEAPRTWAAGQLALTPDRVDPSSWQVWIQDNVTVIGGGAWLPHPTLHVAGSVDEDWAFGNNPSTIMHSSVPDGVLGLPYLTAVTFDLGLATTAGTYKICWCPTWDWPATNPSVGDFDLVPCSGDQEFFVDNGLLVVGYLATQNRYHCLLGATNCTADIPLRADVMARAVLFSSGTSCSQASFASASPWASARNISGSPSAGGNRTVFDFGTAVVAGEYSICVCSSFDDGGDGLPCSRFSEFYEEAGSMTVAAEAGLTFEAGVYAVLNLTSGSGLSAADRLLFRPGATCNASDEAGLDPASVAAPIQVDASGAWAAVPVGASPGPALDSGLYVACLCADFDGSDSDEVACSTVADFTSPAAKLQVTAVQGPTLSSSVSSSITLRLTLARRLAAVDAAAASVMFDLANFLESALGTALEASLQSSPVEVAVTEVSPLRDSGATLDVVVNFTATLRAAADQHLLPVRSFDNASCPTALLEPPWESEVEIPSDPPLLLGCLRLAQVLIYDSSAGSPIQGIVAAQLMISSIPGIVGTPTVLGLGGVQAPQLGYQPVTFSCVRGATCQIRIPAANGTGVVPAGSSSLLVVAGEATCGSTSLQELATLPRAATGVLASNPVDASSPSATSVRLVSLGEPILEGSYTLCFCAGSDSGSGACALDRDFFSLVGSLTVRGPAASNALYCVVSQNCSLALRGVDLSVWDWILVREEGSGSCFDSSRIGFQASDKFLINPAGLPQEDTEQQWSFDLGTTSQTGQYQLCYCAGYKASPGSSAAPCQAPADFTMQVGTLVVRGLQDTGLSFGCVKSSKGDGQAQCALPVQGSSLIPVQDKMLVMPMSDTTSCGEVAPSRGFGISPNPIPLSLANTTVIPLASVNASDSAQWVIERAETPGLLRVCYCADSADGSLDGFGLCSSPSGFYWEVGTILVRGADIGQMYVCSPGSPCEVTVRGTGLSIRDKVRLVGPEDSCSLQSPLVTATTEDFIQAVEANDTFARFSLGSIREFDPPDALALRLCYCADFNADEQNDSCSSPDDFTHAAGVINVANCPAPPSADVFTPPVEDVYGEPGNPLVRLYLLPGWTCLDVESRTSEDLDRLQEQLPLGPGYGVEDKGGATYTQDMVISSRYRQCEPGISAKTGRLENQNFSRVDLAVVGGQPSATSAGLPVEAGFSVQGISSVEDSTGNTNQCATWQVQVLAYACGWDATLVFGALLHISILIVMLWSCLSNQLFYCSAFCKCVKQVDPIVENEEHQQDDAAALRPHAAAMDTPTPGTPSLKALAAGGASADEPDQPLKALASARWALILALLRSGILVFHLLLVFVADEVGDVMLLYVVPLALAAANIFAQLALLCIVSGRRRLNAASRRPQHLLHSFTMTFKMHLDLAVPILARRHHSELWRASVVLVTLELLVQVVYPVVSLLRGLCPGRLRVTSTAIRRAQALLSNPRPSLPEGLEETQVDVKDEKVQAMLEEHAQMPPRRGSVSNFNTPKSTVEALALDKIPQGVSVHHGRIDLQGIASEKVHIPGSRPAGPAGRRMSQVGSGGRRMSQVASGGRRMSQVASGTSSGRRMSQVASGGSPSRRARPPRRQSVEFMAGIQLEEGRSPSKGRRGRRASADLFAPPAAMDDRAPTKGSMESKASSMTSKAEQLQKEELVLHMFRMKALEKHLATRRTRCTCRCGSCCLMLVFPCIWLWRQFQKLLWQVATLLSRYEPEHPEEFRRRRIVGLWSFLDGSGWYVASVAFRRHAENAGGFQLPHFEDRRALISAFVGGFDMAVVCLALLSFYLPRLNLGEMGFLTLAIITTLLQVGRPGIFQAARAVADDLFIDPAGLFNSLLAFVLFRAVMLIAIGFGCARWSWLGYLLWSCSTVVLEGPVLVFCWRSWPIIWSIVSGQKAPWPTSIGKMLWDFYDLFIPTRIKESRDKTMPWKPRQDKARINSPREAPTVPLGSRDPGMKRELDAEGPISPPSVREAALVVLAYRKKQDVTRSSELDFIEAEPCLAALHQLVEDIVHGVPQDLSSKIIDNPHGEVARLHRILVNINRRPPRKNDRTRRVRRLLAAMVQVEKLATLCRYMGPWTRLSYDELHAQILEELWLSRSMVKMHRLLRQPHFRYGSLGGRARLLESLIPSAPRLWLVSARTLQRLGRLPSPREFEHLTLASDAHKEFGSKAVVMIAVHRWRSPETPDPHRVTWRQLQVFARWYRWRWGAQMEVFFWIDYCCVPEIRGRLPEKVTHSKEDIWEEPEALLDSLAAPSPQNRRCSFANLMDRRGLSNLAAWSEATGNALDDEDRAEEEPEEVDQKFVDIVETGRKEEADLAGYDAMFPALFAAADGLVLCTSHAFAEDAWCRLYLSLGYAFLPTGRLMYEVDRGLVHISRDLRKRPQQRHGELPKNQKAVEDITLPGQLKLEDAQPPPTETSTICDGPQTNAQAGGAIVVASPGTADSKQPPTETSKGTVESRPESSATISPDLPNELFDEECMQRFLSSVEAHMHEMPLPNPADWEHVLVEEEGDMGRVQRLTSAALDLPTLPTDTGFRRAPLVYGETKALLCGLKGPKRMRKRESSVQTTQEEESSSDSDQEPAVARESEDLPPLGTTLREAATVSYTYTEKAGNWDDKMLELYFGQSNEQKKQEARMQLEKESLATRLFPHIGRVPTHHSRNGRPQEGDALFELAEPELAKRPELNLPAPKPATTLGSSATSFFAASSSTLKRSLQPAPNRPTLASNWAPSILRFHEGFVSKAVSIGPRGKTASRVREKNVYLPFGSVGSGGLALLSEPLVPRSNVCPDAKLATGVTFDLVIEETDFAYHEGLGIGFTAQVPDEWPSHRRQPPQTAIEMPRTCVVGYDGKWFARGRSELIQGAWNPGKLQKGDVVTAVLAGPPANLMRVLVNGKVVAQKPLSETGLDGEPLSRLWGVVDLEGSCEKVRLGTMLPP